MKRYWKIIIFLLLALACTAFIFSNSLKNGEESKADSDFFMKIAEAIFSKIMPNNQVDWNFVVRKAAHLFEFCILGICVSLLSLQIKAKGLWNVACAVFYSLIIAFADEFIQSFTGRSSKLSDVMIDMTGAFLGVAFVMLLQFIIQRRKKKN